MPSESDFPLPKHLVEISAEPFVACILNAGLFGILSVQIFIYRMSFSEDHNATKLLVYTVYAVEVFQMVIVVQAGFETYARQFMDPYTFNVIGLLWLIPILTALVTLLVECYYAFRIRAISRSLKVPVVVVVLSVVQFGGGLAVGYFAKKAKYYPLLNTPEMLVAEGISTGIWNIGSTLCDIIITVYMTYYLSKFDTKIRRTRRLLKKIIRLTMETGAVTTVIAIITFGLAMIPGNPMYFLVPMGVIGKVYANSLMVLLNSRAEFYNADDPEQRNAFGAGIALPSLQFRSPDTVSNSEPTDTTTSGFSSMQFRNTQTTNTTTEATEMSFPMQIIGLDWEEKGKKSVMTTSSATRTTSS